MADQDLMEARNVRTGCAGWSLPREHADRFPDEGTHLARYAAVFPAVEINSSFYRPHRATTYARWSASVPANFRFSVKMPKLVTHERRLIAADDLVADFLAAVSHLGTKLGPLLIQLPPSLRYESETTLRFLGSLRERFEGQVALEPRHASWFEPVVDRLLKRYRVARVAADPAVVPSAAEPGGWDGLVYLRLHGSPRMYSSAYSDESLAAIENEIRRHARSSEVWCIFDNTAEGSATTNALEILHGLNASASH